MKIFAFVAAICLSGMMSCSQKVCPAYTKADKAPQDTFAKAVPATPASARI